MSYRLERRYDVAPLDAALPADAIRAGGGKRASRAGAREVLRVYRLSLFLRKRVMFTCSLTKSKSQLSLFTELSALTSSRHSSLHIAAFSSKL